MSEELGGRDERQLLITFDLGESVFAIPSDLVQEVVKPSLYTPVHHAPEYVLGIRNLRGRVVTLVDLCRRLELGAVTESGDNRVLIVDWQGETIGLLVDRIVDTADFSAQDLKPLPPSLLNVRSGSLSGIFRQGERTVALLDMDSVLQLDKHQN
ncbi:MAG: chemotaxis protein CheW [Desulfuromonadales bacterium]|nr:chemotaxis protein CheW [Desulfuromonadales bacterium]MBN2791563.1 chemotaxis protein CheW [Desulfuromonadales bacterium]